MSCSHATVRDASSTFGDATGSLTPYLMREQTSQAFGGENRNARELLLWNIRRKPSRRLSEA